MAVAFVLGATVAVAGCGAAVQPSPMPEVARSSEPAVTSPAPTPPAMPAAAEGTSPAAAKAFVRHWVATINHAALTGDTAQLRGMGSPNCESCEAIAVNIDSIYGSGGRIEEENWTVQSLRVLKATGRSATLTLGAHIGREVIVDSDGERTEKVGGKQPMTVFLQHRHDGPRITRVDLVT